MTNNNPSDRCQHVQAMCNSTRESHKMHPESFFHPFTEATLTEKGAGVECRHNYATFGEGARQGDDLLAQAANCQKCGEPAPKASEERVCTHELWKFGKDYRRLKTCMQCGFQPPKEAKHD